MTSTPRKRCTLLSRGYWTSAEAERTHRGVLPVLLLFGISHFRHRKLMKRIEALLQDSSALKAHLVSNLQDLNNSFSELINFGISLAQQIMPYLSDVRGSKTPFQFEHVLFLVRQTASSTVNKGSNAPSPWQGVSDYIANVLQQANALVPLTAEPGNTLKSTCFRFIPTRSPSRAH